MQIPDIKIEGQIKTICEYLFFDQFQDTALFQDLINASNLCLIILIFLN